MNKVTDQRGIAISLFTFHFSLVTSYLSLLISHILHYPLSIIPCPLSIIVAQLAKLRKSNKPAACSTFFPFHLLLLTCHFYLFTFPIVHYPLSIIHNCSQTCLVAEETSWQLVLPFHISLFTSHF